jgi:hypothetical protein
MERKKNALIVENYVERKSYPQFQAKNCGVFLETYHQPAFEAPRKSMIIKVLGYFNPKQL